MKKILLGIGGLIVLMLPACVLAAQGEWWQISSKMEMEGMPFAMPAQTSKICMAKGGEKDPRNTQGQDSNCKMTDVKQSGNTVKFKGTCVNQGETMNMTGETTHDGKNFKTNMKMSGKSGGESINMTMVSSGKYIGGSCDTDALRKKAEGQVKAAQAQQQERMDKMCDISGMSTKDLIASSGMYIDTRPACLGKTEQVCKVLRKEVPRDVKAFEALVQKEKSLDNRQQSVVKACKLNMEGMKKSLCKSQARKGPLSFLEANCPAEAKAYRELLRKRADCEGRGFTSGAKLKGCMGGLVLDDDKGKPDAEAESSGSGSMSSEAVQEGAKALKGLFGF